MEKIVINDKGEIDFRVKEMFKSLRTNIEFTGTENRVLAVTSCLPNDGKTNISYHLAEAIALSGKNVVLMDADLRKSVLLHRLRITTKVKGLSHYLSGQVQLTDTTYATDIPHLFVIPAGPFPPNPSELLGNARFANMIENLRKVFDYVIIDTPPLGSVIDAAIVSKNCDGSILVISAENISRQLARDVKQQLELSNRNILGVVLNKVNNSGARYYGKKYKGYYSGGYGGYYGGYANEGGEKSE